MAVVRLATVSSDNNYAFWNDDIQNVAFGYVMAGINVKAGKRNLLAYLDATETTRVVGLLNSDRANYVFHSLTITRVD